MSFGINDITGFCKTKEAQAYVDQYNQGNELAAGQVLECVVLKGGNSRTVQVSIDPKKVGAGLAKDPCKSLDSVVPGLLVNGLIEEVVAQGLVVKFMGLYTAKIHHSQIPHTDDLTKVYKPASNIKFRILYTAMGADEKVVGGSLLPHIVSLETPADKEGKPAFKALAYGTVLDSIKVQRSSKTGVTALIPDIENVNAFAKPNQINNHGVFDYKVAYGPGTTHRARVLKYWAVDAVASVSLNSAVIDQKYMNRRDIAVGDRIKATVKSLSPTGLVVSITPSIDGYVPSNHFSDALLTKPEKKFKPESNVTCRVLNVNLERKQILLTAKQSLVESKLPIFQSIDDMEVGKTSHGVIDRLQSAGCLVRFYGHARGWLPLNQMSETKIENIHEAFREGQTVRAHVLSVNKETHRALLSLIKDGKKNEPAVKEKQPVADDKKEKKKSDMSPEEIAAAREKRRAEKKAKREEVRLEKKKRRQEKREAAAAAKSQKNGNDSDDDEEMEEQDDGVDAMEIDTTEAATAPSSDESSDEEEEAEGQDAQEPAKEEDDDSSSESEDEDEGAETKTGALSLGGFDWSGQKTQNDSDSDSSDSDEEDSQKKKKNKKTPVEDKTAELASSAPQSVADFERLVVSSPNSSYIWVNYMAYQLQLSEIEKARAIAERALKTINFREEQEKKNVWVALMNLENTYGTEESLVDVFKRSCTYNEPKDMYLQLANIYERSEKKDKAEALWKRALKEFSQASDVWTQYAKFCLQHDNAEAARELLQRCVKVLPKHERKFYWDKMGF